MASLPRFSMIIRRSGSLTIDNYEDEEAAYEHLEKRRFSNGDMWIWCNNEGDGFTSDIEGWLKYRRGIQEEGESDAK